jgi:hypothetical protein
LSLIIIRILTLEDTCCVNDGSYCSHTIVIMILGRKLLGGQLEGTDHLFGQNSSSLETEGIKHDLPNQSVIRDHHCHRSEQSNQVIGKG